MKIGSIRLLLILILGITIFSGCGQDESEEKSIGTSESKEFVIVTSFYPMYIEALNVARDISSVKVINMTKDQTGCLHDYSLTPADLKTLEVADAFVINGAGMEAFMDKVVKGQPNLKIVEASQGIELVKNESDGEDNPHVWLSISNSVLQVRNIEKQLAIIDSENASKYKKNADEYIRKLENQKDKMHKVLDEVKNNDIITFHEAFPYFAKEFKFNIVAIIEREPGSQPTPRELEETINTVKESEIKALFAEPQYSIGAAETIASETGAKIYTLDPAVTGDGSLNSYINIMEQNLKSIEEALK
ncbi:MAG TPA: zinc ABC transporter substrate-binding protein [Clostridiales bacterium]|nr:MAG: metal ABC transporter substrate-binding protein [Clostridiales bacterium GWD2_32_19]HCC07756.1 zinc ABC transporter substrate-binding protein [Clostridiales bacterium]